MSGRGRNRKGRQGDPDPDIEDLQTQISDLREQLQESEAAMEEASEEASRNDSIVKDLRTRVDEASAAEIRAVAKHRDLEAELEEKNNQLQRMDRKAEASYRQASRRHDEMIQEHTRAMAQICSHREKEADRAAIAEVAYIDTKEHCRKLEAIIQANQHELDNQIKAVENRWRQVVLDTEQSMGQRAAKSDLEWLKRLEGYEKQLAVEMAKNSPQEAPGSMSPQYSQTGMSSFVRNMNQPNDPSVKVSQGALAGVTSSWHGYCPPRGPAEDAESISMKGISLDQEGGMLQPKSQAYNLPAMSCATQLSPMVASPALHEIVPSQNQGLSRRGAGSRDVPLPRQLLFNGKSKWESFASQFRRLSTSCGWDESENIFRLTSSLRDEAADYAFCQLGPEVSGTYDLLFGALESRFKERRSVSSYLSQLELRKLQPREEVSQFVADLRRLVVKGYPTADEATRESIVRHHFINGLGDPKASIHVGMTRPQTVEDAQDALEMYNSLQNEPGKPPRARTINISGEDDIPITKSHLLKLSEDLKREISGLKASFSKQKYPNNGKGAIQPRREMKDIECFGCHEMGHYSKYCPLKASQASGNSQPTVINTKSGN